MTKKHFSVKCGLAALIAVIFALCLTCGLVFANPVKVSRAAENVLTLDKLEDFNVVDNGDGTYSIPAAKAYNGLDMDSGDLITPEDALKNNPSDLFAAIEADPTLYDYEGSYYIFNNGLSVSTLKKLLGKEESDTATADEMMCEIYNGAASFVYDGIDIVLPKEITSVGNGAFLVNFTLLDKLLFHLGFSQATPLVLQMLPELGVPAFQIKSLPSITNFSVATEGREQNVTVGSYVLGANDCAKLDLNGFKEVGTYFTSDFSELTGADPQVLELGNTIEKIGGRLSYTTDGMGEITLPSSLKYVGDDTFNRVGATIIIPEDSRLEHIGSDAFAACGFTGELVLPSTLNYIGQRAFEGNSGLTSVVIPEGVEVLAQSTFGDCNNITSITLPSTLKSICNDSFEFRNVRNINIPDLKTWVEIDVTESYGSRVVRPIDLANIDINIDGKRLEGDIVIPEGVTKIGIGAFCSYKGITSVAIPSTVESIGDRAFYNSTDITSVKFPDKIAGGKITGVESSLTTIGREAFYGLTRITEFVIPETVTSIANGTTVWVGAYPSEEANDTGAFDGCNKLHVVYNLSASLDITKGSKENGYAGRNAVVVYDSYDGTSPYDTYADGFVFLDAKEEVYLVNYIGTEGTITLPAFYSAGLQRSGRRYVVAQSTFEGNETITNVTIQSNSVTDIGVNAFYKCTNLETVYIGAGVNEIGDRAFAGCTSLKSVTVVSGLETLGAYAFLDCSSLTEISLQNSSLSSIGEGAFKNCASLLAIAIPDTVITVGKEAYSGCTNATDISIGKNVQSIGAYAFAYTSSLTDVVIPDSVTELGLTGESGGASDDDRVFYHSGLRSVHIGAGLVKMNNTFAYCTNLAKATFAENSSVETLQEAFRGCKSLKKVVLPESVTSIGGLFYDSETPYELHLPANVDYLSIYNPNASLSNSYSDYALFSMNSKCEHLTVYLPEITDSNRETYGKNFTLAMLLLGYPYNRTVQEYANTVFVAPSEDAYKLILNEMYEFDYKTATSPRVAYFTEWYSTAFTNIRAARSCIENMSYNRPTAIYAPQDRLFYLADVTYEIHGADGKLLSGATYTEKKLARTTPVDFTPYITSGNELYDVNIRNKYNGTNQYATFNFMKGADLRYTLAEDEVTGAQYYVIDETYALPSKVGIYTTSDTWTLNGTNVTNVSAQLVNGAMTYVNVLGSGNVTVDLSQGFTAKYSGGEWTVPEEYAEIFELTSVDGNTEKVPTSAGTYELSISLKAGYQFADGTTTATVPLVIVPVEVSVVWTWKGEVIADGVIPEKYYDGLTISNELEMWFTGADGSKVIVPNESLQRYKDGVLTNEGALGAGHWTLLINSGYIERNYPGYVLDNTSKEFIINSVSLEISNDLLENLAIQLDEGALTGGLVYIYKDGNATVPSLTIRNDLQLIEVLNVEGLIARYKNKIFTMSASVSEEYADKFEITDVIDNTGKDIGVYSTIFTVSALANYEFALNGGFNNAAQGLTVNVSDNGKTVTVVKTWYIVQLLNELVNADASATDENELAEYNALDAGWTFGSDVNITAPRLMHGDEGANWLDNSRVSFTLTYGTTTVSFARSEFASYINKAMPAGVYTLTASVEAFTLDAHAPWWNASGAEVEQTYYPNFTREYVFEVYAAEITLDLEADGGYAKYDWKYALGSEADFFAAFTEAIDGKVNYTTVNAEGTHWADYDYGTYGVTYNFARMYNEVYFDINSAQHLSLIKGGANGTYTVYFKIEMPNHINLGGEGNADRYDYYFTVVVYETVAAPQVGNEVYTGSRIIPVLTHATPELFGSDIDEKAFVNGGTYEITLTLHDSVHYRWNSDKAFGTNNENLKLNFTINKANNSWTRDPNMISWQYGSYEGNTNLFIAVSKYLDNGEEVFFQISTDENGENIVEGLEGFTAENGVVDAEFVELIKALPAQTYYYRAYVNGTKNYEEMYSSWNEFAIGKGTNTWAVTPNVMQWRYGSYDSAVNLVLAEARIPDANNPVKFRVSSDAEGKNYLTEEFVLTEGKVPKAVADVFAGLKVGTYYLWAVVEETDSYSQLSPEPFEFKVTIAANYWEEAPSIQTWVVGEYNEEINAIGLKPHFGNAADVVILITVAGDAEQVVYDSAKGVNLLKDAGVGVYEVTVNLAGTSDYSEMAAYTFTFRIFEQPGLAWWAVLIIVVGVLAIAAIILFVLHQKGVLQMLTGKFVIAMRTKATVDATIAAVRANKVAERAKVTVAEAEAKDAAEARRKEIEAAKARPIEVQAADLDEKARTTAETAKQIQKRAEEMQMKAAKLKEKAAEAKNADTAENSAAESSSEEAKTDDAESDEK